MSLVEDNWDYQIDLNLLERNDFGDFEENVKGLHQHLILTLKDGFKVQKYSFNENIGKNKDDDLISLTEQNKKLRNDIENKLEELTKQKARYEHHKKDQKLLSREIKETHEAYLMARKFYKKFLKVYYNIESRNADKQTIFIQFFTEAKKDSEIYSAKLLRTTGFYDLLSTTPQLKNFKHLQKQLHESNDVAGVLCAIRQSFKLIKKSKK